jgi:K+-sensing histidine kinase KdpD
LLPFARKFSLYGLPDHFRVHWTKPDMNQPKSDAALFLASSVHDMKNSISVLQDSIRRSLMQAPQDQSENYREMSQMLYETQRIHGNLIQLLTLYKFGHDLYPFHPETQELGEFIHLAVSHVAPLLTSRSIALETDVEEDCYWDFDSDLINGIVVHAMNNAVHYTKDRLRLAVQMVDNALEIRIEDNGQGFPQQMLDDGIAAMRGVNFNTGSTGLGLYFAAVVAQMHGSRQEKGSIRLENGGQLGGGCFILRLP